MSTAKAKAATTTEAKKLAKLNKLWNERIDKPGRVKYEEMMRLVNYTQNRNVKIKNYNNYVHHANSARRRVNKTNLYDFLTQKPNRFPKTAMYTRVCPLCSTRSQQRASGFATRYYDTNNNNDNNRVRELPNESRSE